MTMVEFFMEPEWDQPFFKRLAKNDTGSAQSNQSGMLLPVELRQYLPTLDEAATSESTPTTDRRLSVELFLGTIRVGSNVVRYQFQTRAGKRRPESWITHPKGESGWHPLWDVATQGDLILFQRRSDVTDRFRMILVRQDTPEFSEITTYVNARTCGSLFLGAQPVTQADITMASTEIDSLVLQPFHATLPETKRVLTRQTRLARCPVFSSRVRNEYRFKCAVSGINIATPAELHEVEAAHVVPLNRGGPDDIRNGLSLTQTLHWAFDRGLFGVKHDRTIFIPKRVSRMTHNAFLRQYEGKPITEAKTASLQVHKDAFEWHMETIVAEWK